MLYVIRYVAFTFFFQNRERSRSGQNRLHFEIKAFFHRHAYLIWFCLRVQKMSFVFMYNILKDKKYFRKNNIIKSTEILSVIP